MIFRFTVCKGTRQNANHNDENQQTWLRLDSFLIQHLWSQQYFAGEKQRR